MKKEYSVKQLIILRSVAILVITIILIALLVIIPVNKFIDDYIYDVAQNTARETTISLVKQFDSSLVTMGKVYNPAIEELLKHYKVQLSGLSPPSHRRLLSSLEAVKKEVKIPQGLQAGKLRVYLINPQGKIVDTNYSAALGINLTSFDRLWPNLKELKLGEVLVQRLTYSRYTNEPRKYGYIKLANDYILEVAVPLKTTPFKRLSNDLKSLKQELKFVERLALYNQQIKPLGNQFSFPTQADRKYFHQLLQSPTQAKKIITKSNHLQLYTYWASQTKQVSVAQKYLIKVVFDFSAIHLIKKSLIGLTVGFIVLVGFIIILFSNNLYKKVISPFAQLTTEMQQATLGDIKRLDLDIEQTEIKEVNTLLATYQDMASELSASFTKLDKLNSRLERLLEVPEKITESVFEEEEIFLSQLLQVALELVPEADYGSIYILEGKEWKFVDAVGHDLETLQSLPLKVDYIPQFNRVAFLTMEDILEYSKDRMPPQVFEKFAAASNPIKSTILTKLNIGQEQVAGLNLDIAAGSKSEFSSETRQTMKYFNNVASAFVTMQRYNQMEEKFQKEIIFAIINILELHDKYTKGHSENVAEISAEIGRELGFTSQKVNQIYWAGLVHDIGKILVDRDILNKPGSLTEEEYSEIKQHSIWGYKVLSNSEELADIAKYIRHHHEWWDGTGYPDGLQGEEIPLVSRIIGAADAWDTMRSDRVYRAKLSKETALQELKQNKGIQFAPRIVEIMLQLINKEKI